MGRRLGGHDDGVAVGSYDLLLQRSQAFDVGEAEGTPMPAVVCMTRWMVSVSSSWLHVQKGGHVQTTNRNEASLSSLSNCSTGFDIAGNLAVIVADGYD